MSEREGADGDGGGEVEEAEEEGPGGELTQLACSHSKIW